MHDSPAAGPAARLPHAEFVGIVALLMALNAMAVDVILPALQQMGSTLGVADENSRQLPLTAYIVAFGISQLFYGPISDRYGRRPVLMVGLLVYTLGCIGGAMAMSFPQLLAMRAVQGIGAGATRVIAVAVVRDTFGGRRMASIMSLAMMVFMVVPIFAPNIGQVILMVAGWRGILAFIAAFGVAMMAWCYLRLPETLADQNRRSLRAGPVWEAFKIVITNRQAFAYSLGMALVFGFLFGFLNSAQQIFQGIYGLGALFPLAFSACAILIAAASFTNARLVRRFGMRRLSHAALFGYTAIAAILFAAALLADGHVPFPIYFGLTLVAFSLFGFIGTNFNALALDPLGHVAGTASSVLGCLQTLLGGTIGALVGRAFDGTIVPLCAAMFVLTLASCGVVALAEGRNLFGRNEPAAPQPAAAP